METDEKNVVGEKHEAGPFVGDPALAKCVVSEVTYCKLGSLLLVKLIMILKKGFECCVRKVQEISLQISLI